MPLYDYRCSQCGRVTEVRHGFGETYAEPCPHCGGTLRRVFNPAPIVFKGSGFYVTDSRAKTDAVPAKPDGGAKPAKPEGPPAAEKPAAPKTPEKSGESAA